MPLRSLLPYRRVAIETPLSPEEARRRIDAVVEPRKWFRAPWTKGERAYEGTLQGDRFRISRIIHYRNAFLPVIRGDILPGYTGQPTTVVLRMRPAIGIIVFMAVWLGGVETGSNFKPASEQHTLSAQHLLHGLPVIRIIAHPVVPLPL